MLLLFFHLIFFLRNQNLLTFETRKPEREGDEKTSGQKQSHIRQGVSVRVIVSVSLLDR